jgi:hypothetical protein
MNSIKMTGPHYAAIWTVLWLHLTVLGVSRGAPPTADSPRPEHRVRFCGFGGDRPLLAGLAALWPNLEYCRGYDESRLGDMKRLGQIAHDLGIVYSLQACAPAFPPGYLDKHHCWAVDFLGRTPHDLGTGHPVGDYCHPATVAELRRNLDVTIKTAGASSLGMVDFVWPWVGGRWGYSPADFAAYRAALKGTDDGLLVIDSGGERRLSFWDYVDELSGVRFQPRDVGCASWDAYEPIRPPALERAPTAENRRNFFLFHALFHYCWARFAQEGGRYAQHLGGELQATLNPENVCNGTDLLLWGRLKATGTPWFEEWSGPWIAIAGYHNLPYFARACRRSGKRLGLIGETGAAGGHPDNSGFGPARPHYWDPKANYAITYALGADAGFNDREEDYFYTSLSETQDPAGPHYDCWRGYLLAMDGFWQYALDDARRPPCEVLAVGNRSVLHYTDNSDYSTNQRYSFTAPLVEMHLDYHQGFFPLDRELLAEHRVILFSPWDYPRRMAGTMRRWLAASPDRVLVTHSFAPTHPCNGLHLQPGTELEDKAAAGDFGLRGLRQTTERKGTITEIASEWRDIFPLPVGTRVNLPLPLVHCEGRPLVKLGDLNLVTEVRPDQGGGRIVYLNFAPPDRYQSPADAHSALLQACLAAALRQAGCRPQAEGSARWASAKYTVGDGSTYLLLNADAAGQPRFTEETASMAPAEKLALLLKPDTNYAIYDLLAETIAERRTDAAGRLPVFLSGKNIRLVQVVPAGQGPFLAFTECQRRDAGPRRTLPARLYSHRGNGRVVLGGLPPGAKLLVDGRPVDIERACAGKMGVVRVPRGEHVLSVR